MFRILWFWTRLGQLFYYPIIPSSSWIIIKYIWYIASKTVMQDTVHGVKQQITRWLFSVSSTTYDRPHRTACAPRRTLTPNSLAVLYQRQQVQWLGGSATWHRRGCTLEPCGPHRLIRPASSHRCNAATNLRRLNQTMIYYSGQLEVIKVH